jgi:cobalt-precorrin-5B (C1)-methyltransferase
VSGSEEWQPRPPGPLRSGYTTGACATAATVGALRALVLGAIQRTAAVRLPGGQDVTFSLASCELGEDRATAAVVKDAGDDPDCTHGALLVSSVRFLPEGRVEFRRGPGVGVVTRPGLPVPPGEPAINPVPRRMMAEHVREVLAECGRAGQGVEITLACPAGERLAERTANPRLGIVGGISILGTTGIVRPFSAAAYIASITQGIDVGIAAGVREFVVTVGARSERAARALFPRRPELAFLQMGIFFGATVKHAARSGRVERLTFVGMPAKFVKVARGAMTLEAGAGSVDRAVVADLAREAGAGPGAEAAILAAGTWREVEAVLGARALRDVYGRLAARCVEAAQRIARSAGPRGGCMKTDVLLVDDGGRVVGACWT